MLRQLLTIFHQTPGPISLDLLAAQLDVDRAVLEGMLAELVRLGRLVHVADRTDSACAACGFKNGCPYVLSVTSAYYALPGVIGVNNAPC